MGYGYGVWIVLPVNGVKTHIPHVTIACNMDREDAFTLYQEFIEMNGMRVRCTIDLSECQIFSPDYYVMDTSDAGWSWGYKANLYANIPSNVDRSCLPVDHHISMQYENDAKKLCPVERKVLCSLMGVVEVADIRSDTPRDWNVITQLGQ
jgi:hypothetical protein